MKFKLTEELRIKMAEEEGYTQQIEGGYWSSQNGQTCHTSFPQGMYDNDNDMDRLVRALDLDRLDLYHTYLLCQFNDNGYGHLWILRATVEQKQEAYCRAKGWVE